MTPSQWTKSFFVVSLVFRQAGRLLREFFASQWASASCLCKIETSDLDSKRKCSSRRGGIVWFEIIMNCKKEKTSDKKNPVHQKNYGRNLQRMWSPTTAQDEQQQEARDELRTCRNAIFQDPLGFRHVELQVIRIEDIMYHDESGHELAMLGRISSTNNLNKPSLVPET
jgi:hypothetical protein